MPKLPRDMSGRRLSQALKKYGYTVKRQSGSHIRLESDYTGTAHQMTVPDHSELKIGTLNSIISDIATYLKKEKKDLLEELF